MKKAQVVICVMVALVLGLVMAGCDDGGGGDGYVFGKNYVITIGNTGGLPATNDDGDMWDFMPLFEDPDPYAYFAKADGSWECSTDVLQDTVDPVWSLRCGAVRIDEGDLFIWEVWDADLEEEWDDFIAGSPEGDSVTLTSSQIALGDFSFSDGGVTMYFSIAAQ